MWTEMREISFSITGDAVTNISRSKLYEDNNLDSALDFLTGCMVCDELSEREIRHMAIEVLNGEAEIVGTYPGSDYGFKHLEKKDPRYNLAAHIKKLANKLEETEEKYQDLIQKYNFIIDHFSDYRKKNLNEEYESEFGETLFEEYPDDLGRSYGTDLTPMQSKMLNDYMERVHDTGEHTTEDYGWLEPDGTFHAVGWAQHQQWASDYLNENYPYKDNRDLHWKVDENGKKHHMCDGDVLIYKLHWILLDSPCQGIAYPTMDPAREMTKAQKEFLYDYYMERDRNKEANALYAES